MNMGSFFRNKILLLNGFATWLVVLIHSNPLGYYGIEHYEQYPIIYWIDMLANLVAVPLFYYISGYLFYRTCSWGNLKDKCRRRVVSLLIPYLIWNTFFVLLFWIITRLPVIGQLMNMGTQGLNSFPKIVYAILDSRLTPLWFVKFLMFFTVLSPVLLCIFNNKYTSLLLIVVSIIASVMSESGCFVYEPSYPHLNILRWTPCYLLGAFIGHVRGLNEEPIRMLGGAPLKLFFSVLFLLCIVVLIRLSSCSPFYAQISRLALPVIIWFFFDITLCNHIDKSQVSKEWMKYTFFIYCSHYFVVNSIMKITQIAIPPSVVALHVLYFSIPIIVVVALSFVAKSVSQYRIYHYLSGGR